MSTAMDEHELNLQQEKDLVNEEIDSVDVKEDVEEYTNESEQAVHVCIPEFHESNIKIENDDIVVGNVDPKLRATPIVYTTRLDHMETLHSTYCGRNTSSILNDICEESKPELKHPIHNPKVEKQMVTSYRWVKLRVSQLKKKCILDRKSVAENDINIGSQNSNNSPVSTSSDKNDEEAAVHQKLSKLKNAELIHTCKPFSIPLERVDCQVMLPPKQYTKVDSKVIPPPKQYVKKDLINNPEGCAYIIKDKSLNETNIFYVKMKVLIDYHRLKGINDSDLVPFVDAFEKLGRIVKYSYICCWYKRQQTIFFLNHLDFPENVKKVMRTPHNCIYGKCVCCCGSFKGPSNENDSVNTTSNENSQKDTSFIEPEDMEIQDLEQELSETFLQMKQNMDIDKLYMAFNEYGYNYNWLQDLLSKNQNNTLLNRALNYNPQFDTKKSVPKTIKLNATLFKSFYCQYQSIPSIEYFELNQYGNIKMYARNLHSCEIQKVLTGLSHDYKMSSRRRDLTINNDFLFDEYKICCWRKRNLIIKNHLHTIPELARFLKSPHPCLAEKCVCCCNSDPQAKNLSLGNIVLPERTTPTHPVNITRLYKFATQSKSKDSQMNQQKLNILPVLPYTVPVKNTDDVDDCVRADDYSNSMTINQNTQMQRSDTSVERNKLSRVCSSVPQNLSQSQFFSHTSSQVSQAKKMPISFKVNTQAAAAVDTMVATILDRFKGVRLTLGDDGKISAELNTPINSLSTAELKVLADILSHAQNQVHLLAKGVSEASTSHSTTANTAFNSSATHTDPLIHNIPNDGESISPVKTKNVDTQTVPTKIFNKNTYNEKIMPKNSSQARKHVYKQFEELLQKKFVSSIMSFKDYVRKKENDEQTIAEPVTPQIPVITNVFSLKDADSNLSKAHASEVIKSWSDEAEIFEFSGTHKVAKSVPIENSNTQNTNPTLLIEPLETSSHKRKSESDTSVAGKIRVVDPAKLGLSRSFDEPVTCDKVSNDPLTESKSQNSANQVYLQGKGAMLTPIIIRPPPRNMFVQPSINSNMQNQPFCYLNESQQMFCVDNSTVQPNSVSVRSPAPVLYRIKAAGNSNQMMNLVPVTPMQVLKNNVSPPTSPPPLPPYPSL